MAVPDKIPVTCNFGTDFEPTDETDAAVAEGAPKKENKWCLMEMSKDDVAALEAGKIFHFKEHSVGRNGAIALCTQDKTWALEFLENSNPMYLGNVTGLPEVKSAEENKENKENKTEENQEKKEGDVAAPAGDESSEKRCDAVCTLFGQCRGNVFLRPWTGDAQKVRDLLTPPSGDSLPSRITTADLQYKVAASPKELHKILEDGPFIECDGAWQLLPAALERELIDTALCIITSRGMHEADVDGNVLLQEMQEHYGPDGRSTLPSLKFLENALRSLAIDPPAPVQEASSKEKGKDAKEKEAAATQKEKGAEKKEEGDKAKGKEAEGSTSSSAPSVPPLPRPGFLALDAEKIKLFHGTQILRQPPAEVRQRYDLPPPMPRAKRLRIGAATGGGGAGREPPLQIEEFCVAFKAVSGKETSVEEIERLLGDRMYVDELEGAVHPLDMASLPPEPRERLKRLFELSSHWKPERISALMAPAVKHVKVDMWLPKWTRTVFVELEQGKEQRMITKKFAGLN